MPEHRDSDAARRYVDAAAELLALPLDGVNQAVVVTVMERLAAFAADVTCVPLANDVGIAGRFES